MVKNLPVSAGDTRDSLSPGVRKIPWRRKWRPAPIFLPGKFHEQRSLVTYRWWGCKEVDITEGLSTAGQKHRWQSRLVINIWSGGSHGELICEVWCYMQVDSVRSDLNCRMSPENWNTTSWCWKISQNPPIISVIILLRGHQRWDYNNTQVIL